MLWWKRTAAFTLASLHYSSAWLGLTAREMAVLLNLDLIKGNAAHAAKVKSRVWMAWHRNKDKRDRQAG